ETAERNAAKALGGDAVGRAFAQVREVRSLDDAEESLAIALAEGLQAALAPAQGQIETTGGFFMRTRKVRALIELHGDVGAQKVRLYLDGTGGREAVGGAIDMALKGDAVSVHLAQLGE